MAPPSNGVLRRPVLILSVLCVLGFLCGESARLAAQALDYSGTWKLNRTASQITKGIGLSGLGAGGAPPTLYISQAANGTIVIGSDINESHARTFRLATGPLTSETGGAKEAVSLSANGQTITVQVVAAPAAGAAGGSTTLVYTKVQIDDPCEKWPTPCRYEPR